MLEEGALEGTCRLVGMLLKLERSQGRAVGHLLSEAITTECNMKLLRRHVLLPSLSLPQALATEAYQLLFDPSGSSLFGRALEKARDVASQQRQRSLEEAVIKSVKGTKGSKASLKQSAPSGGQQK